MKTTGTNTIYVLYFVFGVVMVYIAVWLIKGFYYEVYLPSLANTSSKAYKHSMKQDTCTTQQGVKKGNEALSKPDYKVIGIKHWLKIVNADVNQYPHLQVIGNTRSGKTTLVQAIINNRIQHNNGKCIIIDIKDRPNKWGCDVKAISLDNELGYSHIEQTLNEVLTLLKLRQSIMNKGYADFQELTIIIDEFLTLAMELPVIAEVYKKVSIIGAELNVRLIILSQSDRVKSLGVNGQGDLRDNFLALNLGSKARDIINDTPLNAYPCVVMLENKATIFDTREVPKYASQGISSDSIHTFPVLVQTTKSTGMSTDEIPDFDVNTGIDMASIPNIESKCDNTGMNTQTFTSDDIRIITYIHKGLSANKIYDIIRGDRNKLLARVKELRSLVETQE